MAGTARPLPPPMGPPSTPPMPPALSALKTISGDSAWSDHHLAPANCCRRISPDCISSLAVHGRACRRRRARPPRNGGWIAAPAGAAKRVGGGRQLYSPVGMVYQPAVWFSTSETVPSGDAHFPAPCCSRPRIWRRRRLPVATVLASGLPSSCWWFRSRPAAAPVPLPAGWSGSFFLFDIGFFSGEIGPRRSTQSARSGQRSGSQSITVVRRPRFRTRPTRHGCQWPAGRQRWSRQDWCPVPANGAPRGRQQARRAPSPRPQRNVGPCSRRCVAIVGQGVVVTAQDAAVFGAHQQC